MNNIPRKQDRQWMIDTKVTRKLDKIYMSLKLYTFLFFIYLHYIYIYMRQNIELIIKNNNESIDIK